MKNERRQLTEAEKLHLKVHFVWGMFYVIPFIFLIIQMSK